MYPQAAMQCSVYYIDTDEMYRLNRVLYSFSKQRKPKFAQNVMTTYETHRQSTFYPKKMLVSVPKKSTWAPKMLTKKRINGELYCYWLIMSVTMTTSISSHVKDKNDIFTIRTIKISFSSNRKNPGFSSVFIYWIDLIHPCSFLVCFYHFSIFLP